MTAAALLLDAFVAASPKAPEVPAALLKLGQAKVKALLGDRGGAMKVLDEARKRYEPELARDPPRAGWVPLLKYHHAVAVFEAGKLADARPLFDQVAGEARTQPIGAEAALRSGQCRVAEARAKVEDARKTREQAGNDRGKVNAANRAAADARRVVSPGRPGGCCGR